MVGEIPLWFVHVVSLGGSHVNGDIVVREEGEAGAHALPSW